MRRSRLRASCLFMACRVMTIDLFCAPKVLFLKHVRESLRGEGLAMMAKFRTFATTNRDGEVAQLVRAQDS